MESRRQTTHFRFGLFLALALLLLGWSQLQHEIKAHLGDSDAGCEICLFNGNSGSTPVTDVFTVATVWISFQIPVINFYTAPVVVQPFLLDHSPRGPPAFSTLS